MLSLLVFLLAVNLVSLSGTDTGRILTTLQNVHYQYVKSILDAIQNLTDTLIFVEDNLKFSIQNYLHNLCTETLDRLAILRQSCGITEVCLECFNGTETMEELTQWTVEELHEYLEGRKFQYLEDVEQTKASVRESAFLSVVTYGKLKNGKFEDDSEEYYMRTREKLGQHFKWFQEAVDSIQIAMIERSVNTCIEVGDEISEWYQEVLQCVEEAGKVDIPGYLIVN